MRVIDSKEARDFADAILQWHFLTPDQFDQALIRLLSGFTKKSMQHMKCPLETCDYECFVPINITVKSNSKYLPDVHHSLIIHRCAVHKGAELIEVEYKEHLNDE